MNEQNYKGAAPQLVAVNKAANAVVDLFEILMASENSLVDTIKIQQIVDEVKSGETRISMSMDFDSEGLLSMSYTAIRPDEETTIFQLSPKRQTN